MIYRQNCRFLQSLFIGDGTIGRHAGSSELVAHETMSLSGGRVIVNTIVGVRSLADAFRQRMTTGNPQRPAEWRRRAQSGARILTQSNREAEGRAPRTHWRGHILVARETPPPKAHFHTGGSCRWSKMNPCPNLLKSLCLQIRVLFLWLLFTEVNRL